MTMKHFMISAGASTALAMVLAGPAQADLSDIALVEHDGGTYVWFEFDQQPQAIEVHSGQGTVFGLTGVTVPQARSITPVQPSPLDEILLTPGAQELTLMLSGRFEQAEAEVREGGVWVRLHGIDPSSFQSPAMPHSQPETDHPSRTGASIGSSTTPHSQDHVDEGSRSSGPMSSAREGEADRQAASDVHDSPSTPGERLSAPSALVPSDAAAAEQDDAPGLCPDTASRLVDSPWDLSLLSAHADCLASLGEVENAAGLYERVLAFDPRHFQSALGLARIRSDQGQHEAAANLFDVAASAARTDGQAVQARMAARQARERAGSN